MRSRPSFLLEKVAGWQRSGQVGPSSSSLVSRANEAALANEISVLDKKAMLEYQDELKVSVACLKMTDIYTKARHIASLKSSVDAGTVKALIYGVDELTDVLSKSGDARLVTIQKLLHDFLESLKVEAQTSTTEQGQYDNGDQKNESMNEAIGNA